jgi:GGDEF domain-containing protein
MRPLGPAVDPATGFGNMTALKEAAWPAIASADRAGYVVSVAAIELPYTSDEFARSMSLALRASVRDTDQCYRIDESLIVVLLPMAASRAVARVMERTACMTDRDFAYGVATTGSDGSVIDMLVARAAARLTHFTASSLK